MSLPIKIGLLSDLLASNQARDPVGALTLSGLLACEAFATVGAFWGNCWLEEAFAAGLATFSGELVELPELFDELLPLLDPSLDPSLRQILLFISVCLSELPSYILGVYSVEPPIGALLIFDKKSNMLKLRP